MANTDRYPPPGRWMSARDAAQALGVTRRTLYAYVSRKLLRSRPLPGLQHAHCYARADVERLHRRAEESRFPAKAVEHALNLGRPVLSTSLVLIENGRLFYRGHDAIELAQTRSLAEVASLLWRGTFGGSFEPVHGLPTLAGTRALHFQARAQVLLSVAQDDDATTFADGPDAVAQCGWRILHTLARAAAPGLRGTHVIEDSLARAWRLPASAGADLLRVAMILCAEHELNVSTFAARCVASAGSQPHAVALAGLLALGGTRHGSNCVRAEALLAGLRRHSNPHRTIRARLKRGDRLPGFGHWLYPQGDPRPRAILDLLEARFPRSRELAWIRAVEATVVDARGVRANLDLGLAALVRVLRLPPGASFVLLSIGRAIGWIAHGIEQHDSGGYMRPRARYVGPAPRPAQSIVKP